MNMFFMSNTFSKPLSTRSEKNVVGQVEQTTVGQTFLERGGAWVKVGIAGSARKGELQAEAPTRTKARRQSEDGV